MGCIKVLIKTKFFGQNNLKFNLTCTLNSVYGYNVSENMKNQWTH